MDKIAFLFPGQGAHYVGMAKGLCENYSIARKTFEEANDVLGFDLAKICFEGSLFKLNKMEYMFPALLTASVASFRVYMEEVGIIPQVLAGHSLGEYSALTCAGAIRYNDALKIVHQRGKFAQEVIKADIGAMTIVEGISTDIVEKICKEISSDNIIAAVACYNTENKVSISGCKEGIIKVEKRVLEEGGRITPLIGGGPFHSPLMMLAAEKLKEELAKYTFHPMRYPVISNITGELYEDSAQISNVLVQHLIKPVRWKKTLDYLNKQGISLIIEMSSRKILCDLMESDKYKQKKVNIGIEEIQRLKDNYIMEKKKNYTCLVSKCLMAAVSTPNKNLNKHEFDIVVEAYKSIEETQSKLDKEMRKPTLVEMKNALVMLQKIFNMKKVSADEQENWIRQIIDESGQNYLLSTTSSFDFSKNFDEPN